MTPQERGGRKHTLILMSYKGWGGIKTRKTKFYMICKEPSRQSLQTLSIKQNANAAIYSITICAVVFNLIFCNTVMESVIFVTFKN